jgi:hypothetical protein
VRRLVEINNRDLCSTRYIHLQSGKSGSLIYPHLQFEHPPYGTEIDLLVFLRVGDPEADQSRLHFSGRDSWFYSDDQGKGSGLAIFLCLIAQGIIEVFDLLAEASRRFHPYFVVTITPLHSRLPMLR